MVLNAACTSVTTEPLGMPRITEEAYENPDGTPLDLTRVFLGAVRETTVLPGSFATLTSGTMTITLS